MKGDFGIINENEEINAEDPKTKEEDDPKVEYNRERRKSSFCLAKLGFNNTEFLLTSIIILAPPPPDPVEGTWKLIQCENYEKYLEKIGTGPLSLNMVMRANVVLTITQVREVFFQK